MYEANTTVIGNIVTEPVRRDLPNGEELVSFRMASSSRRRDSTSGTWVDGSKLYLTVSCWRGLVAGVDRALRRGDPVIAHGRLRTREYRGKDGGERRDLEMRASAVGPDLGRCDADIHRRPRTQGGAADRAGGTGEFGTATMVPATEAVPGNEPGPVAEPVPVLD